MDLPKPPEDQELKNIIDKLAQFVARNGPEFEQMTKHKQKDNKKFSFLFGGEFFNYYQFKVTTEQAILKQKAKIAEQAQTQQMNSQPNLPNVPWQNQGKQFPAIPPHGGHSAVGHEHSVPALNHKQLQEQIKESELNLNAQHQVLLQQQQAQIEEVIHKKQEEKLYALTAECDFSADDLESMIQPIIDSCTKEAISNGKSWIFMHAQNVKHCQAIASYLLKRVIASDAEFDLKLHIIYLMNDVIHHSLRKNTEYLKKALDLVVVPVFCNANIGADEKSERKLSKLLKLWETNEYFSKDTIEQLKNPASSLANYQANLITEYAASVQPIMANIQAQYNSLQQQHNDFVAHATAQLNANMAQASTAPAMLAPPNSQPNMEQNSQEFLPQATGGMKSSNDYPPVGNQGMNGNMLYQDQQPQQFPPPNIMPPQGGGPPFNLNQPGFNDDPPFNQPPCNEDPPFNQPQQFAGPPGGPYPPGPPAMVPDFSRPPPGFPPLSGAPPPPQPIIPTVPFYELPAGLIVPLIKLDDDEYTPLDSSEIRLPPPAPPSDRLIAAVELFYEPPSHDRPRNSEGWEQLGLYEFFKAKSHAKKRKQEMLGSINELAKGNTNNENKDRPSRPEFGKSQLYQRRSRSKSPPRRRYRETISPKRNRSRSRSRSRSPPLYIRKSRSPSPQRRSRSRSRSPHSPIRKRSCSRSPTPPSFFGSNYANAISDRKLDESNKGHQLLKRMGWGGAGLGAAEQGRQDPVDAGNIRDKQDQYKGIGVNLNDPFENFRKSKGQAFITRMKARAEEGSKL